MRSIHIAIKQLKDSLFMRHIFIVATGTAAAQAIGFLASPIISRLYSPEAFGGLAILTTLVSLIVTVSALGYESAIVLPKEDSRGSTVLGLSSVLAFSFFVVLTMIVFTSGDIVLDKLNVPSSDRPYFFVFPLISFLSALANGMVLWNNRKLLYHINSFYKVALSLGLAALSIAFGFWKGFANGLIVAFLLSNVIASGLFLFFSWKKSTLSSVSFNRAAMKTEASHYKEFPRYYLVQNFFDAFRENAFVFIINSFFSAGILGAYSFALRIIRVPLNLVSSSISQVAFQRISALKNDGGNVMSFVTRLIVMLAAISLPIGLIFLFFGRELFLLVFGEQWGEAGEYTKILAIWLFSNFISSPVSTIPVGLGHPRFSFYWGLIYNILSTAVFFICTKITGDFKVSLLITSVVSALYLLLFVGAIIHLVKKNSA